MLNNVVLMGRLTATPVLNQTTGGALVTSFSIAVDRRLKRQGEERQTDFINCVAWQKTAEFISKYFKKGDPIAIQGELQTRKYTDKDGNNRVAVEVVINDARFVPATSNSTNTPPAFSNSNNADFTAMSVDDDLPF